MWPGSKRCYFLFLATSHCSEQNSGLDLGHVACGWRPFCSSFCLTQIQGEELEEVSKQTDLHNSICSVQPGEGVIEFFQAVILHYDSLILSLKTKAWDEFLLSISLCPPSPFVNVEECQHGQISPSHLFIVSCLTIKCNQDRMVSHMASLGVRRVGWALYS